VAAAASAAAATRDPEEAAATATARLLPSPARPSEALALEALERKREEGARPAGARAVRPSAPPLLSLRRNEKNKRKEPNIIIRIRTVPFFPLSLETLKKPAGYKYTSAHNPSIMKKTRSLHSRRLLFFFLFLFLKQKMEDSKRAWSPELFSPIHLHQAF
jgi:hypothetical protein